MTKAVQASTKARDEQHVPVAPWRIGVDVGGTFTDLVLVDANNRLFVFKSPSVPASPADGVLKDREEESTSDPWRMQACAADHSAAHE